MKRIVNRVRLKFFQDDANGEWGVAHANLFGNYGTEFNAFWSGTGIFHDVFEHYFERNHKYFNGEYSLNVGGEMCAMGHLWYYYNIIGIGDKRKINPNSMMDFNESILITTFSEIQEAVTYGYSQFGSALESCVPYQKSCDYSLDDYIHMYWEKFKEWRIDEEDEDSKRMAREYRKSVTLSKVLNLHRYGYKMAQRLVPYSYENRNKLISFIDFWNDFCKNNNAKDLSHIFKYLDFTIYRDGEDIDWKAKLISSDYMIEDYIVKHPYEIEIIEKSY